MAKLRQQLLHCGYGEIDRHRFRSRIPITKVGELGRRSYASSRSVGDPSHDERVDSRHTTFDRDQMPSEGTIAGEDGHDATVLDEGSDSRHRGATRFRVGTGR